MSKATEGIAPHIVSELTSKKNAHSIKLIYNHELEIGNLKFQFWVCHYQFFCIGWDQCCISLKAGLMYFNSINTGWDPKTHASCSLYLRQFRVTLHYRDKLHHHYLCHST